jgi:predicted transcriptional regulator of viral defense system
MGAMISPSDRVLALAQKQGILRPRDLEKHGIPRHILAVLYRSGRLVRVGRGLYVHPETSPTENHDFALLAKRTPDAIICLLSALRFHELTTQLPGAVWIALHPKARRPQIPDLSLEVVRFSGKALTEGIEDHLVDGVPVRITSPARTVIDCFRYRRRIGRDVAVEALRDAMAQKKATVPELVKYAVICRVTKVVQPYIEMFL